VTPIPSSAKRVLFTTLSFSLLNPHVYLDTVVLIGGYSSKFSEFSDRLIFGLGASATSWIWFFSLATLATFGNSILKNPRAMRIVSLASGLILMSLSVKLGLEVWTWGKSI
jgi:L-lysine exporter family protein LysE/ArgO